MRSTHILFCAVSKMVLGTICRTRSKLFSTGILFAWLMPLALQAQINLQTVTKAVNNAVKKPLSNDEVVKGLREALTVGSNNSAAAASKTDGYYRNPSIIIPFPSEAKEMEQKLRSVGMGKQVDQFVLTLNRAAEDAAKQAAPVFVSAIKGMSINDGMSVLRGNNDAATSYLKNKTTAELRVQFKPIIQASLRKVEVTKYWNPLMTKYNRLPFVKKMNPNLEDYVTQRAIDGLFFLIAQEEYKIRKNPAARITDLLKRVFGS